MVCILHYLSERMQGILKKKKPVHPIQKRSVNAVTKTELDIYIIDLLKKLTINY